MKDVKRQYMGAYAYYDRAGISRHLEKMAARGWLLERIGSGGWHYRRIEPRALHFSIVYFPQASRFDPYPSENLETFRDYCAAAGWILAADTAQMQIFYNEQEHPVPIETDSAVELKNLHRSLSRTFLPAYGVFLLEAMYLAGTSLRQLNSDAVDLLSSNLRLINLFTWLPLLLLSSAELLHYALWLRRAKSAVSSGAPLPEMHTSHWLNRLIWCLVALQLIALFCSALSVSSQTLLWLLAFLSYMGIMVLLVSTASSAMRRLRFRAWVNRLVSTGMILALTVGMIAGMTAWIIHSGGRLDGHQPAETYEYRGWTRRIYHDDIPLRLENLVETDYDRWSTEARRDESILLSRTEYSQQARIEDKGQPELEYTIVQIKVPTLYDFVEQALLKQEERFNEPELPEFWRFYQAVDPAPWGALRAYQCCSGGEPRNQYLLCFDDRFAAVTFDQAWTVTETQMAIAAEKLKNA